MSIFKTRSTEEDSNRYKIKFVTKRDGTIKDFDINKIKSAVYKAFCASPETKYKDFSNFFKKFESKIRKIERENIGVEEIQDLIEHELSHDYFNVAKRFIIYREKHKIAREEDKKLIAKISDKLEGRNIKNQNANVDERSFGGRLGEAARVVTKDYALKYCMSDMSRRNHLDNRIYIHDLDSYAIGMHNCLSIPFDDLLANGFNTRQGDVRPAKSVGTAFQLVAVIFQLQSLQQFGGVSATHLDWTMVPYVRLSFYKHFKTGLRYIEKCNIDDLKKSDIRELSITDKYYSGHNDAYNYAMDMTQKEVYQAVEGLYHNLKINLGTIIVIL